MTPRACEPLAKAGMEVWIEPGAGVEAGYPDSVYETHGAKFASREELFQKADIVAQVRTAGANPAAGKADVPRSTDDNSSNRRPWPAICSESSWSTC